MGDNPLKTRSREYLSSSGKRSPNGLRTISNSRATDRAELLRTTSGARRRALRSLSRESSFSDAAAAASADLANMSSPRLSLSRSGRKISSNSSSSGGSHHSKSSNTHALSEAAKRRLHLGSSQSAGSSREGTLRGPNGTIRGGPRPNLPRDPGDERTLRRKPKLAGEGAATAALSLRRASFNKSSSLSSLTGTGDNAEDVATVSNASAMPPTDTGGSFGSPIVVRDQAEAAFIARAKEQAEEIARLKRIIADKDVEIKKLQDAVQAAELRAEIAEDLGGITPTTAVAADKKTPAPSKKKDAKSLPADTDEKRRHQDQQQQGSKKKDAASDDSAPLRERPSNLKRRTSIMALDVRRAEPLLNFGVSQALSRLDQLDEDGGTVAGARNSSGDSGSGNSKSSSSFVNSPRDFVRSSKKTSASLSDMVSRLGGTLRVVQTPRGGPSSISSAPGKSSADDGSGLDDSGRSAGSDKSDTGWQRGSRSRSASGSSVTLGRARARSAGSGPGSAGLEEPDEELLAKLDSIVNDDADNDDDDAAGRQSPRSTVTIASSESTANLMSASNSFTSQASAGSGARTRPEVPRLGSARGSEAVGQSSARSSSAGGAPYGSLADLKSSQASGLLVLEGEAGTDAGLLVHVLDEATGKRDVKAGTIDRLVEMLAPSAATPDAGYLGDFLLSYSNFMTGSELIDALIARWHELDDAGDDPKLAGQRAIVRVRIINVLKKWLEQRSLDFDENPELLAKFMDMLRGPVRQESPQWATRIETAVQTHGQRAVVLPYLRSDPVDAVLAAMKRPDAGLVHRGFSSHRSQRAFVGSEAVAWLCDHVVDIRDSDAPVDRAVALMQGLLDDGLVAELRDGDDGNDTDQSTLSSLSTRSTSPSQSLSPGSNASKVSSAVNMLSQASKSTLQFRSADSMLSRQSSDGRRLPRFLNRMKFYHFVLQATDEQTGEQGRGHTPESLVPPDGRHIGGCVDLEPLEVARQLTLIDQRLFAKVDPIALQHKKLDSDANAYVDHFNRICYWVSTEIVTSGAQPEERCETLVAFIRVGEHLMRMCNYNGLFALIGGFHVSSVNRMHKMWTCLKTMHKESHESLERLLALTNPEHNYTRYRKQITKDTESELPCIPYFGQYLRDLTHIRDGNADTLLADDQRTHLVNFEKMRLLARVSSTFARVQQMSTRYRFAPVPVIEKYLTGAPVFGEAELYAISVKVEPRTSAGSHVVRRANSGSSGGAAAAASDSSTAAAADDGADRRRSGGGSRPGSNIIHRQSSQTSVDETSENNDTSESRSLSESSKSVSSSQQHASQKASSALSPRSRRKRRNSVSVRVANLFKGGSKKSETEQRVDELTDHFKAMGIVPEGQMTTKSSSGSPRPVATTQSSRLLKKKGSGSKIAAIEELTKTQSTRH